MAMLFKKMSDKTGIKQFINPNTNELEYLFKNSRNKLEGLTVIESERQLALDNLRKLTQELQDKRLQFNTEPKFNFFTK